MAFQLYIAGVLLWGNFVGGELSSAAGIAVSGGYGFGEAGTTAEVFVPATGLSCSLPTLPADRVEHTMDSLYICGGGYTSTTYNSCLHLHNGKWTISHTLVDGRVFHCSWETEHGLVLMGGNSGGSPFTSEIVPTDGGQG